MKTADKKPAPSLTPQQQKALLVVCGALLVLELLGRAFNYEWVSVWLLWLPFRALFWALDHLVFHPHPLAWIAALALAYAAWWVHQNPARAREWVDRNLLNHSALRAKLDRAGRYMQ
eukprot:m51a1_g8537 hypothetical protein (117) ;mRNA; f:18066-18514